MEARFPRFSAVIKQSESLMEKCVGKRSSVFLLAFDARDRPKMIVFSLSNRLINFSYLKDNKFKDINTFDFHMPTNIFYNSSTNPDNQGFCSGEDCLGNGVFNLSKCFMGIYFVKRNSSTQTNKQKRLIYKGISVFLSQPHFLNADSKFLDSISGLEPKDFVHDSILSFEPVNHKLFIF